MTDAPSTAPPDPRMCTREVSRARRGATALVVTFVVALLALGALDAFVLSHRRRYVEEIVRLRASMSQLERARADAIMAAEENTLSVAIELVRRQARIEPTLHLSVALDSAAMYLEREGALLRSMPVQVGPERSIGIAPDTVHLAAPRGVRTVAAILTDSSQWEVPEWVYVDRGDSIPAAALRTTQGALGPVALLLDGGTIVYSLPASGPLAEPEYVMPGAIRARAEDLRAIAPNLTPGMRVYFY